MCHSEWQHQPDPSLCWLFLSSYTQQTHSLTSQPESDKKVITPIKMSTKSHIYGEHLGLLIDLLVLVVSWTPLCMHRGAHLTNKHLPDVAPIPLLIPSRIFTPLREGHLLIKCPSFINENLGEEKKLQGIHLETTEKPNRARRRPLATGWRAHITESQNGGDWRGPLETI